MLEVSNLMVFFANALALNDFSMEIAGGEIRGVIGSNSAGKTTFMHAVGGLIMDIQTKERRAGGEHITVLGQVLFQGEDITFMPPAARVRKGVVLSRERHPIFAESSVTENLKIAGYTRKPVEVRETIDFVFELFQLSCFDRHHSDLFSAVR